MSELEGWAWVVPPTGDVSETDPELVRELEEQEAADNATAADLVAAAVAAPPMPAPPTGVEVPAVALCVSRAQAAALLSISLDHFERHVLPELRVVQSGRRQLVPVLELQEFVNRSAARALKG